VTGSSFVRAAARRLPGARSAATRARFGDLARTEPLGRWGYERGTPVDRWYIRRWLQGQARHVRGHALEVKEDLYASELGAATVEVLDIDEANPRATLIADLCDAAALPRAQYDAAVVTQTLQFVADPAAAVRHLVAALRPGGSLLLSVPCLSRVDGPADRWRWTPAGLRELLEECVPGTSREVDGLGNGLAGRAFLFGLAVEDLPPRALEVQDPALPLLTVARLEAG
jgi:SAM-dependent methyltransferase